MFLEFGVCIESQRILFTFIFWFLEIIQYGRDVFEIIVFMIIGFVFQGEVEKGIKYLGVLGNTDRVCSLLRRGIEELEIKSFEMLALFEMSLVFEVEFLVWEVIFEKVEVFFVFVGLNIQKFRIYLFKTNLRDLVSVQSILFSG